MAKRRSTRGGYADRAGWPATVVGWVFFFSGCSALVYQVVWQRLLTVYYGVGAISTTLVVTAYMLGLGVGALLGGFVAERCSRRISLYCGIEFLIGAFGIASLRILAALGSRTAGSPYGLAFCYMFLFLCLPTLLMGMTLPLLTKIFNSWIEDFLRTVSFLYFINTLGAAVGALVAAYIVISLFGLAVATYTAAAINGALVMTLLWLRGIEREPAGTGARRKAAAGTSAAQSLYLGRWTYVVVFVIGFLAIGYELVWFRFLNVLVKASPYSFSTVLFVYLVGIAAGSYGMDRVLRAWPTVAHRSLVFALQLAIGVYVLSSFTSYYYLTRYTPLGLITRASFEVIPHPPCHWDGAADGRWSMWFATVDILFWPMVFVFVPTLLMGASFPLISLMALRRADREGQTVGNVYFFNVLGNVSGGAVTGFLLLGSLGSERTLLVFATANLLLGLLATDVFGRPVSRGVRGVLVAGLVAAGVVFFPQAGRLYELVHGGRRPGYTTYVEEGTDSVVVTAYRHPLDVINFINGHGHGNRPSYGSYHKVIEAVRYAPEAENALIIGFGTGSITEAVLKSRVQRVTLVEISPTLIRNLRKEQFFDHLLNDPRLQLVIDDGRRYLLQRDEKFDLILMDPLRSTTAYSNNLYSVEFFQLVRRHLTARGVYFFWMDERHVLPKTAAAVFPHLRVYSTFCLASEQPLRASDEAANRLLERFPERVQRAIRKHADSPLSTYLGDRRYVETTLAKYPVNRDWAPVSEYYLGLKLRGIWGQFD